MNATWVKPNNDVVEMTKQILQQHDKILGMNARLLMAFTSPFFTVEDADLPDKSQEEMKED